MLITPIKPPPSFAGKESIPYCFTHKIKLAMKSRKLISKTLTKEGLLLTYEDKTMSYLSVPQVSMLNMLGQMPKVGDLVPTADSVNPITSEVSQTWVTLGLA